MKWLLLLLSNKCLQVSSKRIATCWTKAKHTEDVAVALLNLAEVSLLRTFFTAS